MRIVHTQRVWVTAAALLAAALVPASAAELQLAPPHKPAVAAVHAKKPVRHHPIRFATGPWLPRSGCGLGCAMPLVLGVAF